MKKRTRLSPMALGDQIYDLTPDAIERFDCIYRSGKRDRAFRAEAKIWCQKWRRELKTDRRCRWFYLTSVCAEPLQPGIPMHDIPSAARYLCWRVEMEVRRSDQREVAKKE